MKARLYNSIIKYCASILMLYIVVLLYTQPVQAASIADIASSSDYARDAIISLADRNIISGDSNGYFNPRQTLKRSEMVKLLVKALDIDIGNLPAEPTFRDVPLTTGHTHMLKLLTGPEL